MNKKDRKEVDRIVVALDKLYKLVDEMPENCLDYTTWVPETAKKINTYKELFLENLDIIEHAKDNLLGYVEIKPNKNVLKLYTELGRQP